MYCSCGGRVRAQLFIILMWIFALPLCSLEKKETKVVIIGDGIANLEDSRESEAFIALLKKVNESKPEAVFFTGNFIAGLEQSTSVESLKSLKKKLKQFIQVVQKELGARVKIYPVIGNHTFVNSQAVQVFKDLFKIHNSAPLAPYQWAYSVELNQAQFIVLATGLFERKYLGYRDFGKSMPLLDWVEKELRSDADRIKYRFVISHLPAFSSRSSEGIYVGLDKDPNRRDAFWSILKNYHVLAYFSSHEPIYDRSNREGVWQIISGGAGEKTSDEDLSNIFQHYLLITIPEGKAQNPFLKSIGINGKVWDEFEVIPADRPVHQLRISIKG